jgi:hypothetical protein
MRNRLPRYLRSLGICAAARADGCARRPRAPWPWLHIRDSVAPFEVPDWPKATPSASAVAQGGELLGQAAAEGRHEREEA